MTATPVLAIIAESSATALALYGVLDAMSNFLSASVNTTVIITAPVNKFRNKSTLTPPPLSFLVCL